MDSLHSIFNKIFIMKTPELINEALEKIKYEQRLTYIIDMLNLDYSFLDTEIIPLESFLEPVKLMEFINKILIKPENTDNQIKNIHNDDGLSSFSRYISFIDISKLKGLIQQFLTTMVNDFQKKLSIGQEKRILLYSAFMLERIITQKTLHHKIPFINQTENRMEAINKLCYIFEESFFVEIPSTEREWLHQLVFNRRLYL